MPKQVDHAERRREIAAAVARIAMTRGLAAVSFRDVAAEAGISVSLVQHYFGTKDRLMVGTLDIQSARLAAAIVDRLEALEPDAGPLDRVRAIALTFLPDDEESRAAMLLYLGFAGAALTDSSLRSADAFRNAESLLGQLAGELDAAKQAGEVGEGIDSPGQARVLVSLVLGLSLGVLLEQTTEAEAHAAVDAHLRLLRVG